MDGLTFKNELEKYINLSYDRLKEQRKCLNHNSFLEVGFMQEEYAQDLLLQYVETLKYTKKRWFREPEVLYKDFNGQGFTTFCLENSPYFNDSIACSDKENLDRWNRYLEPYTVAINIIRRIISSYNLEYMQKSI